MFIYIIPILFLPFTFSLKKALKQLNFSYKRAKGQSLFKAITPLMSMLLVAEKKIGLKETSFIVHGFHLMCKIYFSSTQQFNNSTTGTVDNHIYFFVSLLPTPA
jgi:hypothetical protein